MATLRTFRVIPDTANPFETTISARTATSFTVTGPNSLANWTGTGLTYDAQGKPDGGFLTGLSWKIGGQQALTITGMQASIPAMQAAADGPGEVLFAGNDTLFGHAGFDRFNLAGGNDTYYAGAGSDFMDDTGGGHDKFFCGSGNDTVFAGDGNDLLDGGANADTLRGEAGRDLLRGGLGTDKLYGGLGADTFDFNYAAETVRGIGRDVVYDFVRAQGDKIDLSGIDANGSAAGLGRFTFVGSDTFGGTRAELRYAAGILSGDLNGDRVADFEIRVVSATGLNAGDIIL